MGYSAEQSGITLSSGGVATLMCMPLVGYLAAKMDPRKLIAFGFFITAAGFFYMSGINLQMNMGHAAEVRFFQSLGLGFLFVPITTMSYVGVSQDKSNDVSGMTNLARKSADRAAQPSSRPYWHDISRSTSMCWYSKPQKAISSSTTSLRN